MRQSLPPSTSTPAIVDSQTPARTRQRSHIVSALKSRTTSAKSVRASELIVEGGVQEDLFEEGARRTGVGVGRADDCSRSFRLLKDERAVKDALMNVGPVVAYIDAYRLLCVYFLSHTHTLSLSLTHTHIHVINVGPVVAYIDAYRLLCVCFLSHTHTLSLSHTHTHIHVINVGPVVVDIDAYRLLCVYFLSLTHTHTHPLSFTHTPHTHTHTNTLAFTLSLSHTHTHTR